ncbi:MAG: hypothetical protein U0797_18725 [Gemmataceae bacterium]
MARSLLDRQLARVRRRLFLNGLLTNLARCWLAATALGAVWVVVQPYLLGGGQESLRWVVLAGLGLAATGAGIVLATRRSPSRVAAALALDDRFGLKERATTSQALTAEQSASPAGRALLADVEEKLAGLPVQDRFPVRPPRLASSLLAVCALGLGLLAALWNPTVGSGGEADSPDAAPAAKADVDQEMQKLAAKPKAKPAEAPTAKELERIDREIEKFTRAPRESREEVRDRVRDATALEEQIRREQKEQADRIDAFREAMKQQERLRRKSRDPKDAGPDRRAADALARGDMAQAQDELQRLSRKLEKEEEKERLRRKRRDSMATDDEKRQAEEELNRLQRENEMTQEERERLAKQLEQMENDLKRLTRSKDEKAQDLRDLADTGELDRDQLDRELDQLEKADQQLDKKQLEDLARKLGECKKCLGEGKDGEAAKKLARAAEKAGQCGNAEQGQELARRLAQVQQVKRALCRSLEGGVGAGRRPEAKDGGTAHKDAVSPGEPDRGKTAMTGQGPVGGFQGPRKPSEMQEEIRQAAQEAPAAIDRQRLPPSASKMARGYFEKVRGPEKDKKK